MGKTPAEFIFDSSTVLSPMCYAVGAHSIPSFQSLSFFNANPTIYFHSSTQEEDIFLIISFIFIHLFVLSFTKRYITSHSLLLCYQTEEGLMVLQIVYIYKTCILYILFRWPFHPSDIVYAIQYSQPVTLVGSLLMVCVLMDM